MLVRTVASAMQPWYYSAFRCMCGVLCKSSLCPWTSAQNVATFIRLEFVRTGVVVRWIGMRMVRSNKAVFVPCFAVLCCSTFIHVAVH